MVMVMVMMVRLMMIMNMKEEKRFHQERRSKWEPEWPLVIHGAIQLFVGIPIIFMQSLWFQLVFTASKGFEIFSQNIYCEYFRLQDRITAWYGVSNTKSNDCCSQKVKCSERFQNIAEPWNTKCKFVKYEMYLLGNNCCKLIDFRYNRALQCEKIGAFPQTTPSKWSE